MHWVLVWQWDTKFVIAALVAAIAYVFAWWRLRQRGDGAASVGRLVLWFGGLITLTIAVLSAVDILSDSYFSMHMIQHVLIIDLAPPLLLLARPVTIFQCAFTRDKGGPATDAVRERGRAFKALRFILKAPTAWLLATVVICAWHIPVLYDYALNHEMVHEFGEHLSMFIAFLIWWHPLIGSLPELPYLSETKYRFYYLLASILTTRSLGLVILFWPHVLYSYYLTHLPPNSLSLMLDQQLGGMVMLAGGMAVFLTMALPLQYKDEFPLVMPSTLRRAAPASMIEAEPEE